MLSGINGVQWYYISNKHLSQLIINKWSIIFEITNINKTNIMHLVSLVFKE
jgi:hypothetical protein